ncbi:sigma factor [Anaerovoracaceae bacterium 42-11]
MNILGNKEDAEECLSDTYLKTWNSIPPNRPAVLRTFIGKITRNVAFDLYKKMNAEKRVLKALSRFLKGEIDITLYSEAYRAILEEEQLRQIWPGALQLSS